MKVLFIVSAYPRGPGDVITPWLVETIRRLRGHGVEVEVLAPAYRGGGSQVVEGVRVHRFRYAPAVWERLTHEQTAPDRVRERPRYLGLVPGYVAAGAAAAARLARGGRFDVVHVFWPIPHAVLGLGGKWAGGVPMVCTFFGVELTWAERGLRPLRPLFRWLVRRADAVTAISTYTATALRRLAPGTPVRIVPFGAAAEAPERPAPRERRRGPLSLLFVGRLVERKGVHVLLDALAALDADGGAEPPRLVVVGDGPEGPALRERARRLGLEARVEFTGGIPAEELRRRFDLADALVLPAVRDAKGDVEGLGVVLIEALSRRLPVIASRSGGIVDIVEHERTGLLVTPGDPGALAEAIRRYDRDPGLARALAEEGERFVAEAFGWEPIIRRLVDLYRSVAPGAPPHASE